MWWARKRQALRGRGAAQSHAPAKAGAGTGRRHPSQEHHHDRADRRGQNGNRPPPGAPDQFPLSQDGSFALYRSRLRRARRGIDDPRPGGSLHRHGARRKSGRGRGKGRAECRGALARSAAAALRPAQPRTAAKAGGEATTAAPRSHEQFQRTREKLRAQLREGKLDDREVEVEMRDRSMPAFEVISSRAWKRWISTSRISFPASSGSAPRSGGCT